MDTWWTRQPDHTSDVTHSRPPKPDLAHSSMTCLALPPPREAICSPREAPLTSHLETCPVGLGPHTASLRFMSTRIRCVTKGSMHRYAERTANGRPPACAGWIRLPVSVSRPHMRVRGSRARRAVTHCPLSRPQALQDQASTGLYLFASPGIPAQLSHPPLCVARHGTAAYVLR